MASDASRSSKGVVVRGAPDAPSSGPWPAARWPAEWEPHAATWLAWPHARDTWGERLAAVEGIFAGIVEELQRGERVAIAAGNDGVAARARKALAQRGIEPGERVALLPIETDDAWIRDTGPVFVERQSPVEQTAAPASPAARPETRLELAAACFRFDAWGGKYPPWTRDAAVARQVARASGVPRIDEELVLEGGSIDGDGNGTVLTTEECLLHPNRGGGTPRRREAIEAALARSLGARHVVWLGRGIAGDDTDGHVDDVTRFVGRGVVVTAIETDTSDANHDALRDNRRRLRSARDAAGRSLDVVELPMPPPLRVAGQRLPASYANFYVANGLVLMPSFGSARDARAHAILAELFAGRRVVDVPAADLVVGFGAIHCLTQQQPRGPRGSRFDGDRPGGGGGRARAAAPKRCSGTPSARK